MSTRQQMWKVLGSIKIVYALNYTNFFRVYEHRGEIKEKKKKKAPDEKMKKKQAIQVYCSKVRLNIFRIIFSLFFTVVVVVLKRRASTFHMIYLAFRSMYVSWEWTTDALTMMCAGSFFFLSLFDTANPQLLTSIEKISQFFCLLLLNCVPFCRAKKKKQS